MPLAITIAFPVGPNPAYKEYLPELMQSIRDQRKHPFEVIIVDDAAGLNPHDPMFQVPGCRTYMWKQPWRIGLVGSLNTCMALAQTEYVYLAASDDVLMPNALLMAADTYENHRRAKAWYFPVLKNDEPGHPGIITQPIMVGMIPRDYFLRTGGLVPATEASAPDSCWHYVLEAHYKGYNYIQIGKEPTYYARYHKQSHTQTSGKWGGSLDMVSMGNKAIANWEPPVWTQLYTTAEVRGLILCTP